MKDTDLAYLAGVIDSDGSISVRKSDYSVRRGVATNCSYWPRIKIKQVDSEAIVLAQSLFGGTLYKAKSQTANGKDLYAWEVTNRKAQACLQAILPYLRIKRLRALNGIECAKLTEESIAVRRKTVRPTHITEALEACYMRSRELNRTGKEVGGDDPVR